jgi:hypothetical protein
VPSRRSRLGLAHSARRFHIPAPYWSCSYVLFPFPKLFMAVISLSSPLPFLPRHSMNLPSLPSEVLTLTASYPSWQPFHTITPPWSSKPHHPTMTTLPPIQRQYHYRDTACSSHLSISSFHHSNQPYSASSCHHPSASSDACSSSLGRIACFVTLLGVGTETSDAPSGQRTF